MPKIYITFGQIHVHQNKGKFFNKDCVAVISCESEKAGRELAFVYFDDKWHQSYYEEQFSFEEQMPYYPRGLIEVN